MLCRDYIIYSRDDLLDFAVETGKTLTAAYDMRKSPVFMTANGDAMSGKALFGLGVASVCDPALKFDRIPENISADHALEWTPLCRRPVVFENFGRVCDFSSHSFDRRLRDFEKRSPGAQILIASNIERVVSGAFNYAAKGLQSEVLDLHAEFTVLPGDFTRRITLTARHPHLIPVIGTLMNV